jgi:hypothetical protein
MTALAGNSDAKALAVVAGSNAWFPKNASEYGRAIGAALRQVSGNSIKVIGTTYSD